MRARASTLLRFLGLIAIASCASLSHRELENYRSRTFYTCCNVHYEGDVVNDANYHVGSLLPLGTPVHVQSAGRYSVKIRVPSGELTLRQDYGRDQESFSAYVSKLLVPDDPRVRLATFPPDVQQAIIESRVERGMTKEQVIMALGYPPTHQTPSTAANEWTYWSRRLDTYTIAFDDAGKVSRVGGSGMPTLHGAAPDSSPLSRVQLGMGQVGVENVAGKPTDTCGHITGKAFIPFYFGNDSYQTVLHYKGEGRVVMSAGGFTGPHVSAIEYDPSETGYCQP